MGTTWTKCVRALIAVIFVVAAAGLTTNARADSVNGNSNANGNGNGNGPPAAFSTTDVSVDGAGHCLNGNGGTGDDPGNCNIYDGTQYAWMDGGPATGLNPGTYFFAVLVPSDHNDPNDGSDGNLSDGANGTYVDRTFTVNADGSLSYSGSHDIDSLEGKIRLAPYDDTTNGGGVYTMAICELGSDGSGYPAEPSTCNYDNFKIQRDTTPPAIPLTVTKNASGSDTKTYAWTIGKTVDNTRLEQSGPATFNYTVTATPDGGTVSDVSVTGTITVFNPNVDDGNNTVDVSGVNVTDQLSDGTTCDVTGGTGATLSQAHTDFPYTCSLSGLPDGALSNTVTATWPTQVLANGSLLTGGSTDFTFDNIVFDENAVHACVDVTDTDAGTLGSPCASDGTATYNYPTNVDGTAGTCVDHGDTATFSDPNDASYTDSASKTVTLCRGADLTVTKDAAPTFNRTWGWSITKNATPDVVKKVGGGTAAFNYTVKVTHDTGTDSNWQVNGSINVTNPNDWEDVTADVTDAVDNGGTCTVNGGAGAVIGANSSATLSYACAYVSAPSPKAGTNTATATWDADAYKTPDASSNGHADFVFDNASTNNPNNIHNCVSVTDTYAGNLGTPCSTDPATTTYTYGRNVNIPTWNCSSFDNTATFTATDDSTDTGHASKTVRACGPAKTGALTMGYWQNNNGQNIIGSYSGTNCQALRTWLNGYNPFSDLTATTCAGVKTYATNIIKAANASGAAMNAMLKGQDLATSLDVYFSDPALGGNRISAPGPIGAQLIDLVHICKNIPTCTTIEDTSSAFASTPRAVTDMLRDASNASSAGGSNWYTQTKTKQELAKDSFDAINNQVAFGP